MKPAIRFLVFSMSVLLAVPFAARAQKEVLYDQYIENPMAINPAYTGIREDFNITLLLRRRWLSIPSAPLSQTLATDGTIAQGKVGLGFMALNDQMSPFATTGFYGSASYIGRAGSWKLAAGAQGGVNVLPVYDVSFSGRKVLGSFGVGLWATNDHFYAGVSKPELLALEYSNTATRWSYSTPLYLTTGGKLSLNDDFTLAPNGTIIFHNTYKTEVHFGSKIWYHQHVGVGAFYRTGDINRLHLTVEVQFGRNLRLGYVYDSRTIESRFMTIGTGPQGMHELLFRFIPNPTSFSFH